MGHAQGCTFAEIISGDESLHHQLKRQDRVNSVFLCTLSRFKSFKTINKNFLNYYRLNNIQKNNMPVQKISLTFSDKSSVLHYSTIRNKKLAHDKLVYAKSETSYPYCFAFHLLYGY